MDLVVLNEKETPYALRALRDVVASNGSITPAERRFIEVIAELHGTKVDVGSLPSIAPGEVAEVITEPHQRKRVVQLAAIAAMVEGEVTSAGAAAVKGRHRAGGGRSEPQGARRHCREPPAPHAIRHDATHHGEIRDSGLQGGGVGGHSQDARDVWRRGRPGGRWKYKQLGLLPEGTLGREFWEHCTKNRFGVPGEKGGIPERMVFHDFGHVLAGYDTRPESEIQQGAFQGGFVREDGFAFLMFVIIQFHLGVKVTPITDGSSAPTTGSRRSSRAMKNVASPSAKRGRRHQGVFHRPSEPNQVFEALLF
jgi:hypothetical protein